MTADPVGAGRRISAVILDWAGTTVDHGSRAPVFALVELFDRYGVAVTEEQARRPMGRFKLDHIREIAADPSVATGWQQAHGRPWTDEDALALYEAFGPLQDAAIVANAALIEGVVEAIAACRERGYRIGSTTGYPRAAMDLLAPAAARQGYAPDAIVCPDEVPAGRPAPWMLFRNLELIGAYPPSTVVKVGDTPIDMTEGINAGTWVVGISRTGNLVGRTAVELDAMDPAAVAGLTSDAEHHLLAAGAHDVVTAVSELLPALDRIEGRLAAGERP